MAIRTFAVVDPSTAEEFYDRLGAMIQNRGTHLKVRARLVADELSVHRHKGRRTTGRMREFDFRILDIHPDPLDYYVTAQDSKTHRWVHIAVGEDVSFTVVS